MPAELTKRGVKIVLPVHWVLTVGEGDVTVGEGEDTEGETDVTVGEGDVTVGETEETEGVWEEIREQLSQLPEESSLMIKISLFPAPKLRVYPPTIYPPSEVCWIELA